MWIYIVRRLLAMIPTLFGITVVAFCIMQMAPGDPLLNSLGAEGAQGKSTQTREAYLIQKRDLKLDKPILLNFRGYYNYQDEIKIAAFFRSRTEEEIIEILGRLRQASEPSDQLNFLVSLKIDNFDNRLSDTDKHSRLAKAIRGYIQVYCEDIGKYGVPAVIELLQNEKTNLRTKIGLINCLGFMVVEAHKYAYSKTPSENETHLVTKIWETWWKREKSKLPELDSARREVLSTHLETMAGETSRSRLFQLLEDEYVYERRDMAFFAETLLGESTLREKVISSIILNLYVPRSLKMEVVLDSGEEEMEIVIENWLVHYEPRQSFYNPNQFKKTWNIVGDTQYAHMVWRLVTFNFGRSATKTREPVREKIWRALVVSAPLMLMAQLIIYLVAIPLGIICSVNRGNWVDRLISLKLFFLFSVPPFVAGMMFLLFFCYGGYLKWFPMERLHSDGAENFGFIRYTLDYLWHSFLPVVCLSLFSLAGLAMYSRTSMLDVLGQDYIRTARAKGVPGRTVIFKHGLRNALIPILTLFSNFLPAMLGGSVLIEYLFNIPGMGRMSWESIDQQDFPTLMALIYVQAIVVLLSILITDILYVFVDPRITFDGQGKAS